MGSGINQSGGAEAMKLRSSRSTGSRSSRGFTLLEIMIALFLFTFIVAAIYSSWIAIMRGTRSGLKAAAEAQRSRMAMQTLEIALSSARMFMGDRDDYTFEADNGDKAYLSFVADLPKSFPRSGRFGELSVRRVTFGVEPEPGAGVGDDLVMRQSSMFMDWDVDEREHPVVLAKNVKKFETEFWDDKELQWVNEWTRTNELPVMVKINLQVADGPTVPPRDTVSRIISIPTKGIPAGMQGRGGAPGAGGASPVNFRPPVIPK
jgi:prepilin-type N-terminal cleavage/methylation domain-containing protein